jgi:hypothetical protein
MSWRHLSCRPCVRLLPAVAALVLAVPAAAGLPEVDLPENLTAVLDLRLVGAGGEQSWTDGGLGKTRFGGGDDGGFDLDPVMAEASLVWQPPLSWDLTGTVSVAAQHEQDQPVDLVEAFLSWRPAPRSATRFSARAGLFWPPVSLEHDGPAWSVADMITPSAINSWIGEEVKVIGLEATAVRDLGGGRLAATVGLFGFNDTAGTLLSFRGWALHDQKSAAFSRQPLPPLNAFIETLQPRWTTPTVELDGRPGIYARLSWRPAAPVSIDAFYYRNRGDPAATTSDLQWGWNTEFLDVGARIDISARTRLLAQALAGTTDMGPDIGGRHWVETRFRSAYARLTHETGPATLSGRIDLFDTSERGLEMGREESEQGWAVTAALAWPVSAQGELIVEALHVESERGARGRLGIESGQAHDVIQAALRLTL